ncbi:MAG TPA: phosphatase PAP2 family protein [Pyrinomonadaceae bacterium]|nr:phosphatase PAP2 family protein [Pyrinomonadaceae bacterium]
MRIKTAQRLLISVALAFVGLTGFATQAQTLPEPSPSPTPSSTPSLEREFFKNILQDQKAIWTSPLHLQRADSKWMIPFGIGSMALITTDRITGDEIAESTRQVKASRIVSRGGSTLGTVAVTATFYLVGRAKHDSRARETGVLSAEALIDGAIVGSALKAITQRTRPLAGIERSEFFDGGNSFPSGHSVQAWSVATVIAQEYSDHPLVQVAAYGAATAVSLSRFTGHKHYISDVVVGSAIGYGIGRYVYRVRHRTNKGASSDDGETGSSRWPAISPHLNRQAHQYGVTLTWSFLK